MGTTAGAGSSDDPYAKIDIDFTKVKSTPLPGKPFERKSEEEKQADRKAGEAASGVRSSLKGTKEPELSSVDGAGKKKEVRFGKSITYQVDQVDSMTDLRTNEEKKIIDEKDLSDGRDETERIKQLLKEEEQRQLDEI